MGATHVEHDGEGLEQSLAEVEAGLLELGEQGDVRREERRQRLRGRRGRAGRDKV